MLRKTRWKGLLAASAMAAWSGAQAQPPASAPRFPAVTTTDPANAGLGKQDRRMVIELARANLAEIEAGKLAQGKSQDPEVKRYAQQMIDDHSKALKDVQALAKAKGLTLPAEPDAKQQAVAARLASLSGAAFDKAYMRQAGVAAHTRVHAMLQQDQVRARDPDVKALALKMLPTVDQHLKAARQMAAATGPARDSKSTVSGDAADKGASGNKPNR